MGSRLRIAVLASGRGSNLGAILNACAAGVLDAEVVAVFSDRAKAGALLRAAACGVPCSSICPAKFETRSAFDTALFAEVDRSHPDLIVCAGFMRIISSDAVAPRMQKLINIHPSLLPKYTGLHTHQRALDAGDREHGASVHFVIPALDAGPVIAQTRVPIEPGDDADTLAARLLPAEHHLLVQTIGLFSRHSITHHANRLHVDAVPRMVPWQM